MCVPDLRQTLAVLGLAALLGLAARALAADPPLPTRVTIDSDRLEWVDDYAVYSGHVRLEAGALLMHGERVELRQAADRQFQATVTGAPATLDHSGEGLGRDGQVLPLKARAQEIVYDSRTASVQLQGDVFLQRGRDEIRGQSVRYAIEQRRIQAVGAQDGQVRIVIDPSDFERQRADQKDEGPAEPKP